MGQRACMETGELILSQNMQKGILGKLNEKLDQMKTEYELILNAN